ncbi:apolipoprotein N-acyltransferase [Rhodovarius crocodyli]|uniref:Apolipoprotein N-acyltransferase n=1 Tax=Rhodovarius crocodyli TaxID=1979269 RepID=A0A437MDW7_9PROT|nr:apolipoprotein N-acyltransferase [Rhodovarius crocodyli]
MKAQLLHGASRPLPAVIGLGALSALALPPLHAVPILLVVFPALLSLLGGAGSWRRAAVLGFAFAWGHHAVGLYWVTHAMFADIAKWWWLVPFAAPGLALPVALTGALVGAVAWMTPPGWRRVFAFAGTWVIAEIIRGYLFTGFPWNLLGTVWAFHPLPLQPAAVIGTHGLSLLTVLLACLPALRDWRWMGAGAAVLACWMGYGAWRLAQPSPPDTDTMLVLVQANVAQDVKWRQDQRMPIFQRYLDLTALAAHAARAGHPDAPIAVIWPETASPFLLSEDAQARQFVAQALPANSQLLAGSIRAQWNPAGELDRVYNALVGVNPAGEVTAVFDKHHLVPFGEYMPLDGLIPIRMVTGGRDFTPGPGLRSIAPGGLPPFSPLICYEVIFPGQVVGETRPAWLLNITNDAWFGYSAGPFQHLASSRLRAVEEGLPMVRAAQTGISAVFDSAGRELRRLALGTTGTLAGWLPGAATPTVFSRWGLLIPCLLSLICVLAARPEPRRKA